MYPRGDQISYRSISPLPNEDKDREHDSHHEGSAVEDDPLSRNNQPFHSEHLGSEQQTTTPDEPTASKSKPPATKIHRSAYILVLVILYAFLALFSWNISCILTDRPMTTDHYGVWFWDRDNNGYGWASVSYIHSLYVKNETWYRTARVIQSIVGVLTIPLTSAVCSSAAVIYVQRCRHASPSNFTVRQMMVLADKGWTDPTTYTRLLFKKGGWKRYGSGVLVLAVLLNVLGGIISPIQQIFLSSKTIKTPTRPQNMSPILDIPDKFGHYDSYEYDENSVVVMTRKALASAAISQVQPLLWKGANVSCNSLDVIKREDGRVPMVCMQGGVTLGNMSTVCSPVQFDSQIRGGLGGGFPSQLRSNSRSLLRPVQ